MSTRNLTRYLSIAHLETVAWIARLGSFTAAAARLHTTQPAISARVRDLEATLGMQVFRRKVRGVELTLEGREFVRNVEPLLLQLERLSLSVSATDALRGTVRIGAGNICMDWFPTLVLQLRQTLPQVGWEVEIGQGNRLMRQLEAHKLDLAIVPGPVDETKFRTVSLGVDRMIWAVSAELLARHQPFELERFLHAVPIWSVQRESFYWHAAISALAPHQLDTHMLNGIDNLSAAMQLVQRGAGIGLLSRTLARDALDSGQLVLVPGMQVDKAVEFRIVAHKDDERALIATIIDSAREISTFEPLPSGAAETGEEPDDASAA